MASTYLKNFSGLIVNAKGIQLSDSFPLSHQDGIIKHINTSFHAKLVLSNTKKESFFLKNHIELSEDDIEHVNRIFDIDEIVNRTSSNGVFLTIKCSKIEFFIEKQEIKPSDELIDKVKGALKQYDPYNKLMDVFNSFGYFLPTKLVFGHKIYRIAHLIVNENSSEPKNKNDDVKWTTLENFSEYEIGQFLNQWEEYISPHNVDVSFFASVNGELIMKYELKKWIEDCLKSELDSLSVISCEGLYPLYEIFDLSLRQEVETVVNKQKMVLMTGRVPIKEPPPYSYCIKFPVCLKSNDYQVFGKIISRDGEPIDKVTIKFNAMDTNGFLIFVECQKVIENDSQIAWIIIGIPAKVGYFSTDTRKIKILSSGNASFALESVNYTEVKEFEVPKNLPPDTVFITTFKYPLSNYEPNFIGKIQYLDDKERLIIKVIDKEEDEDDEFSDKKSVSRNTSSDESYSANALKYSDHWYFLQNPDDDSMIYLNKIGQKISSAPIKTYEDLNIIKFKKFKYSESIKMSEENKMIIEEVIPEENIVKSDENNKKRKIDDNKYTSHLSVEHEIGSNNMTDNTIDGFQVVGDAVQPFLPLFQSVSTIVDSIVKAYKNGICNQRICLALIDRVEIAQQAVKSLQRQQMENEELFRKQDYYNAWVRFVTVLENINKFVKEVTQLSNLLKFLNANAVKDAFDKNIKEFEEIMNNVNDSLNEQIKELAQLSEKLDQLMKRTSSTDFQLLEAFKEPGINPQELISDPLENDSGKTILKRTYRGFKVACKKILVEKNDVKSHAEFAILHRLGTCQYIIGFHGHSKINNSPVMELCYQRIPYENIKSMPEIEQLVRSQKREKIMIEPSPIARELFKIIKQEAYEKFVTMSAFYKHISDNIIVYSLLLKMNEEPHCHACNFETLHVDVDYKMLSLNNIPVIKTLIPFEMGYKAHQEKNYKVAWECFSGLSDCGNNLAKYWKGYYLLSGYHVEKDMNAAIKLFKEAADNYVNEAQLRYAITLIKNNSKEYSEIIKYIKMSANNGNKIAYNNLAIIYMNGKFNELINKEKAKHYAKLAALKNSPKAIELLKKLNVENTFSDVEIFDDFY
ncbi:24112_t:CDS:2 [Gigaspora margarita]|uniref:24112_t:CDS:1 n=1 Tax=Gigaspora margarita TaxID=4874 RepID=A0ABN7UEL0_GIGMA|nr:24112_t:CDS:2 [Gigaspora margarita]